MRPLLKVPFLDQAGCAGVSSHFCNCLMTPADTCTLTTNDVVTTNGLNVNRTQKRGHQSFVHL